MGNIISNKFKNREKLIFPVCLYLVGIMVFTVINYERSKAILLNNIDRNLFIAANSIKTALPKDFHDRTINKVSISKKEYWQNIITLTELSKQLNISFLYTFVIKNNKAYYTSCSTSAYELKNREQVNYWQEYCEVSKKLLKITNNKRNVYKTTTNKRGTYRTALIPMLTPNGSLYVIGADYDISYIKGVLRKEVLISSIFAILLSLLIIPFAYILIKSEKNFNYFLQTKVQERTVQLTHEINEKTKIQSQLKNSLKISKELTEKAKDSNKAKDEFLAKMSHEIRTPLNVIVGVSTLLNQSDFSQEQSEYLTTIKSASEHLLSIVDDILDFSLIESKKVIIEKIKFNVYEIVNYSVSSFTNLASHKNISLKANINERVPQFVIGDQSYLRQILFNLIGNAVKFTEKGGVLLNVTLNNFDSKNNKVEFLFKIEDTGIGISPENEKNIFDKFSQVDSSTRRKYGGTGLGLAICKHLLDILGGKIWFESNTDSKKESKGSTFYFTLNFELPDNKSNNNSDLEGTESILTKLPKLKILLAEDNLLNIKVAKSYLEKSGHVVFIANNGIEVLRTLKSETFDVILMDIEMPEMDGLQASQIIRNEGNKTPIIALTAHALNDIKEKCEKVGMNYFITKPIDFKNLGTLISKVLNQK